MKAIIGFLMTLIGVSAFAADIVHTPYAAFVANCTTGSFSNGPQTDENGGIWSYGYRTSVASSTLTAFNATQFTRTKNTSPNPNLTGMAKGSMPYVCINATDNPLADSGACPARPATPKNEFIIQPELPKNGLPVIRFTAPRTGRYTVSAVCEPTACGNKAGSDTPTSFHLVQNGTLLQEIEIPHAVKSDIRIETLEAKNILLERGEFVDLVVGPGLSLKDYAHDASSVKITVTESDCFYSLGDDMADSINAGKGENPFCDGRWFAGYCDRKANDPFANYAEYSALKWGFSRNENFVGYNEEGSTALNAVYCCVNITSSPQAAIGTLDPGEVFVLPHTSRNAAFRFTTPEDGTWKVTATVRNLQMDTTAATRGIKVFGLAGGHRLLYRELIGPNMASATLTEYTSRLKAGAFIDLVIDSRGDNSNDTTALKLFVEKVADGECPYSDAGRAFNVEMAKKENATNPFVDADGVKWEAGQTTGAEGAFSTLPFYKEDKPGYLAGWMPSETGRLPRLQANYNCSLQQGTDVGFDGAIPLYDDQFYLHPAKNGYGVLRYYAPSTGVYRVTSVFRDACVTWDKNKGVDCHIRANDHIVATGLAIYWGTNKVNGGTVLLNRDVAFLEPQNLYLQEGEPLDFSVGITRDANYDATAVAGTVRGTGLAEDSYVNVDFKAAAGAAFTGRGRIGWANPRWNAMVVGGTEATKQNLRMADGVRSTVTLAITHGGEAIATGVRESDVALLTSGIRSENTTDVYTFTLGGLTPQATYRLCLYGRAIDQNQSRPQFTVGSTTTYADGTWFQKGIADLGIIDAKADANGEIIGTFRSSGQTTVDFFGLQVGGSFTEAPPSGMFILLK